MEHIASLTFYGLLLSYFGYFQIEKNYFMEKSVMKFLSPNKRATVCMVHSGILCIIFLLF